MVYPYYCEENMVFEKLTETSTNVLAKARAEASRVGWHSIEVQHVLLGLLGEPKGIAAQALRKNGLQLDAVREQLGQQTKEEKLAQPDDFTVSEKVEELLALSNDFAIDRGKRFICPEHLLLALLEVKNWRTRDILDNFGIDIDRLRADIDIFIDRQNENEAEFEKSAAGEPALALEKGAAFEKGGAPLEAVAMSSVSKWPAAQSFPQYSWKSIEHLFSHYRQDAVDVVTQAQEETRQLGHNFVGTEQLLIGVVADKGIAGTQFKKAGVSLKEVRRQVEKIIGRGSGFAVKEITYTPRAKKILLDAMDQAFLHGSDMAGAEHILLALIDQNEGIAGGVLENLKVDIESLKHDVIDAIKTLTQAPTNADD